MRFFLFAIGILLKSCLLFSQGFNEEIFLKYKEEIKVRIESDLREELVKVGDVRIIPVPMYEIKAKGLNKIWLTLDAVNNFGILLKEKDIIGFAFKENNGTYKLSFFNEQAVLGAGSHVKNQPAIDTLMIADKKVTIDVSSLHEHLQVINPDSVKITFGRDFSFNEKLCLALDYNENICWIYSFVPGLDLGMGIVENGKVSFIKFVYPTQPVVYRDIKSFFLSQYPTMKEYRRLKRFWNRK